MRLGKASWNCILTFVHCFGCYGYLIYWRQSQAYVMSSGVVC